MEFCLPQFEVKVCAFCFAVVGGACSGCERQIRELWSLCFGVSDMEQLLN